MKNDCENNRISGDDNNFNFLVADRRRKEGKGNGDKGGIRACWEKQSVFNVRPSDRPRSKEEMLETSVVAITGKGYRQIKDYSTGRGLYTKGKGCGKARSVLEKLKDKGKREKKGDSDGGVYPLFFSSCWKRRSRDRGGIMKLQRKECRVKRRGEKREVEENCHFVFNHTLKGASIPEL